MREWLPVTRSGRSSRARPLHHKCEIGRKSNSGLVRSLFVQKRQRESAVEPCWIVVVKIWKIVVAKGFCNVCVHKINRFILKIGIHPNVIHRLKEGETIRINVKNKPANGAGMLSAAGLSGGTTGTEKVKPLSLAPPPVASTKTRTAGTENFKPLSLAPPPSASGKIRSPLPPPPNDPAAVRMTSTSQNAAVKGHNDTARRSTDAFTDFSQLELSVGGKSHSNFKEKIPRYGLESPIENHISIGVANSFSGIEV
ncbi:Adaptin ear-binding coat-associated protein 1 NECAP-1 [Artemisia annua]|uniref:Adaptin ear-binding coat-associated protein 1 NECAP-1 n=1 Tax=Artemisia annua TaxID=35608 RepID=A0A2U1KPV5_ARTAN|nr:Adaptin ear-binding coat-associated protein 1 NECAP-1 [Artemisia annua]